MEDHLDALGATAMGFAILHVSRKGGGEMKGRTGEEEEELR